jgi:hypothetical protein
MVYTQSAETKNTPVMTKLSEINWVLSLHGTVKCKALSNQFPVDRCQMSQLLLKILQFKAQKSQQT